MTTTATTASQTELASRLRLAVMRLARRLRQHGGEQATPSQTSALVSLERTGSLTIGDLAAAERVQPPTMTRIVAALEEGGLVIREEDLDDRRLVRVRITAEGRRLLERSRSRKTAYLAQRLRDLSQDDRATLARAAEILERMVEDGSS